MSTSHISGSITPAAQHSDKIPQHDAVAGDIAAIFAAHAAAAAAAKDRQIARLILCRCPRSNYTMEKCGSPPHHQELPPSTTTAAPDPNPVADDNEPDPLARLACAYIATLEREGKTLAMIRSTQLWRLYNRLNNRGAALESARSFHRLVLKLVEERLITERRLFFLWEDCNDPGFVGGSLMNT